MQAPRIIVFRVLIRGSPRLTSCSIDKVIQEKQRQTTLVKEKPVAKQLHADIVSANNTPTGFSAFTSGTNPNQSNIATYLVDRTHI